MQDKFNDISNNMKEIQKFKNAEYKLYRQIVVMGMKLKK